MKRKEEKRKQTTEEFFFLKIRRGESTKKAPIQTTTKFCPCTLNYSSLRVYFKKKPFFGFFKPFFGFYSPLLEKIYTTNHHLTTD